MDDVEFDIFSLEDCFKEAFAMHELLRRIGYLPDQIYIHLTDGTLGVVLIDDGKDFYLDVGETILDEKDFYEKWNEFSFAIKMFAVEEDDLQSIWKNSLVYKNRENILLLLVQSGFTITNKPVIKKENLN